MNKQDIKELAKVQAFYYNKIAEGMSVADANKLIQSKFVRDGDSWFSEISSKTPIKWSDTNVYRIKPETVIHKGGEMPKPYQKGDIFYEYYASLFNYLTGDVYASKHIVHHLDVPDNVLPMAFKTKADAEAAGKVIYMRK